MAPTVALLTATGLLGTQLAKTLGAQDAASKIKLVVLHRPSSDLSALPASTERRPLDIETATAEDVATALQGVDILVSATNRTSAEADARFIESLAAVKTLQAYIPSDFSVNWTEEEASDKLNLIVWGKTRLEEKLRSLGVPAVPVHNGLFEPFVFGPVLGLDAKGNTVALYGDALTRKLPVTSPKYLAEALAQLVVRPVSELVGKTFTVVEYETTGQEVVDALTAANGKVPTVTTLTDADLEAARAHGPLAVLGAAARKKWGAGSFPNNDAFVPVGVQPIDVRQTIAVAIKA